MRPSKIDACARRPPAPADRRCPAPASASRSSDRSPRGGAPQSPARAPGSAGTAGSMAKSLTSPTPSVMRISSVFLSEVMLAAKLAGTGCAADDEAARGAAALAAGEDPQQAGGRAAGRGGELVLGDVDDPGALADRNAGQGHRVAGIEPALRHAPDRQPQRQRPRPQRRSPTERHVQARLTFSSNSLRHRFAAPAAARSRHWHGTMALIPDLGRECVVSDDRRTRPPAAP